METREQSVADQIASQLQALLPTLAQPVDAESDWTKMRAVDFRQALSNRNRVHALQAGLQRLTERGDFDEVVGVAI